jgi:hypothetical protein
MEKAYISMCSVSREEVVYQIFNQVKHSQLTSLGILYKRAEFWATDEKEVWCCVAVLKI